MSNDLGNFINKKLNDTEKRLIFDMGPLKLPGPFPKDPNQGNRSFSESYYIFQTKYGPVNRFWLCYSPLLDATYCQPTRCFLCKEVLGVRVFEIGSTYQKELIWFFEKPY